MLPFFIEAAVIAKGSLDAVKADPVFNTTVYVTSPFIFDRENIEIPMGARRLLGRPLNVGQLSVAGGTTPVSIAGALVQNTAESLALSAIRMAVDNLPQSRGHTSGILDMKYGFA